MSLSYQRNIYPLSLSNVKAIVYHITCLNKFNAIISWYIGCTVRSRAPHFLDSREKVGRILNNSYMYWNKMFEGLPFLLKSPTHHSLLVIYMYIFIVCFFVFYVFGEKWLGRYLVLMMQFFCLFCFVFVFVCLLLLLLLFLFAFLICVCSCPASVMLSS